MKPPMTTQLDFVSVVVLLLSSAFSPTVAAIIGPYIVILAAATLGAGISLGRREPLTRAAGFRFFLACNVGAIIFTVPAAVIAKDYVPESIDVKWLFAAVAFVIGVVGDSWGSLAKWSMSKAGGIADRLIDMWISRREGSSGNSEGPSK